MTKILNLLKTHWFTIITASILLASLGYAIFFNTVRVSGSSMEPSFSDGDLLIMETGPRSIDTGDVVSLDGGDLTERVSTRTWNDMIKRVVAVPGETVEMVDNILYINGEVEMQDFHPGEMTNNLDFYYELAEDEFFVLGDNRNFSGDSRDFGPVLLSEITGSVLMRVYSGR